MELKNLDSLTAKYIKEYSSHPGVYGEYLTVPYNYLEPFLEIIKYWERQGSFFYIIEISTGFIRCFTGAEKQIPVIKNLTQNPW